MEILKIGSIPRKGKKVKETETWYFKTSILVFLYLLICILFPKVQANSEFGGLFLLSLLLFHIFLKDFIYLRE